MTTNASTILEPEAVTVFKRWLHEHDGYLHPLVQFVAVPFGLSATAADKLLPNTPVASCPFVLAITSEVARNALGKLLLEPTKLILENWNTRQLICSYICLHWVIGQARSKGILVHFPYLSVLPSSDKLRTSLHFTPAELDAFKGTNLHWATIDREREWRREWNECQSVIASVEPDWEVKFTWERYLTAATYLTSRAFPSTILSPTPTLQSGPSSEPVLLPGVDLFDHARGSQVSWVVSCAEDGTAGSITQRERQTNDGRAMQLSIGLVINSSAERGQELFNNYGVKSNAELIVGYGFSLPRNPDDAIVLKIGGTTGCEEGKRWQVGRNAQGADAVWEEILRLLVDEEEVERTYEIELDASDMLADMTQTLLDRLPDVDSDSETRPEVALMLEHYVEGQRDILQSVIGFARDKERIAVETARLQGVELV